MDRPLVGFLAFGAAAAAVAIGAAVSANRRQQRAAAGRFPQETAGHLGRSTVRETVESGGMTLKHYRSAMPIRERLGLLQDLVHKSVQDPEMRKLALSITRECPARDGRCEADAIDRWTRKHVRYTGDVAPHKLGQGGPVEGVDMFQSAARTVEFGGGDCDDHSVVNCTLAILNGLQCKFRVTSPTKRRAEDFTHIYALAGLPKNRPTKWVAMDTTLPGKRLGVEAPFGKRLDVIA